ncbi:zincin-like metallopeptidase domain-containing protein [Methylosinus sporium]|uniref:zincin-like metallopeptidase domain-containing protein n=1 Tax=Methylosinus sporium TaxID=428 RepID=UPI003839CFD8
MLEIFLFKYNYAHCTGVSSRLNRDLSGRFDSASYSREELVADIASCFVNSELGLPTDIENHASHLSYWVDRFRRLRFVGHGQARCAPEARRGRADDAAHRT